MSRSMHEDYHDFRQQEKIPRNGAPPRPDIKVANAPKRMTQQGKSKNNDVLIAESGNTHLVDNMNLALSTRDPISYQSPTLRNIQYSNDNQHDSCYFTYSGRQMENQLIASNLQVFESSGSRFYGSVPNAEYYTQQNQIRDFSRMALESSSSQLEESRRRPPVSSLSGLSLTPVEVQDPRLVTEKRSNAPEGHYKAICRIPVDFNMLSQNETITQKLGGTGFLMNSVKMDDDGNANSGDDGFTFRSFIRHFFYNPNSPELTALQQFVWAVLIGIVSGLVTALWKMLIEFGIDLMWKRIPEQLYLLGFFTDDDGKFPMYHYLWILPSFLSSVLSYVYAALPNPIPTQDEWITSVHSKGVQDHRTVGHLLLLSTVTMWSGLSLGPELPLVLVGGMAGSWLGLVTKQSLLQARVLNFTGAAAAISGYFGFPMAGALFVLELPHRMGLQYFEALSPATIASIVSVLSNRLVTGNDVTGYFRYPFLTASLPSSIFSNAIIFGLYGCLVGMFYLAVVKYLKKSVHSWFHQSKHADQRSEQKHQYNTNETNALLGSNRLNQNNSKGRHRRRCLEISNEPSRAALAGAIVGFMVGVIGIFFPHILFWGEAQLQNLIDKGRTPLPVFGSNEDSPVSGFSKHAFCMLDPSNEKAGFGIECSSMIVVMKIIATGLSLGTGIIGGQFWGPLYVGCAAAHLLQDVCVGFESRFGFGTALVAHPCVMILCTMGSAHVVTFRTHIGIMLILTVTISAFSEKDDPNSAVELAGDYSAVFPLLVVSVYVAMMLSRDLVFYRSQRSRGDIIAVPEVLCQPGMAGEPVVVRYDESDSDNSSLGSFTSTSFSDIDNQGTGQRKEKPTHSESIKGVNLDQNDVTTKQITPNKGSQGSSGRNGNQQMWFDGTGTDGKTLSSARLDELLSITVVEEKKEEALADDCANHRRCYSLPVSHEPNEKAQVKNNDRSKRPSPSPTSSKNKRSNTKGSLVRVQSFGNIEEHQPELLDQARLRAASSVGDTPHHRIPSISSNSSKKGPRRIPSASPKSNREKLKKPSSDHSILVGSTTSAEEDLVALSLDDIEQSFDQVLHNSSPLPQLNYSI